MNYSVILLGATVSLSMFIRLCVVCGAIEVNSKTNNGELSSDNSLWKVEIDTSIYGLDYGDPLNQYAIDYKQSISGDDRLRLDEQDLDNKVQERINYLRVSPQIEIRSAGSPLKLQFEEDFYNQQICGIYHNESMSSGVSKSTITDGSTPEGCVYNIVGGQINLVCNDTSLTEIPRLPALLYELFVLNTQIKEVNQKDFGSTEIKNVKFLQNKISEIKPYAFANIKGIQTLEILNNRLPYLAFEIYLGLNELTALHLDGNVISFEIYKDCKSRNISDIPLVLPKLRVLSLRRNPITLIPEQMWGGLRESPVTLLDMSFCGLKHIHNESFTFLPALKTLYLTGNPDLMASLPSAFQGLRGIGLNSLSLGANGITNLYEINHLVGSIVGSTLRTLDYSENPIQYINPDDIPPSFIQLDKLNLAKCNLIKIPGSLNLLPNLRLLDLSENLLTGLPDVSALTKLNQLLLTSNPRPSHYNDNQNELETTSFTITENGLKNLSNLMGLYLADTPLRRIKRNTFSGLTNLQFLFLDKTRLENIEDESFSDLEQLKTLQLKSNPKLTTINSFTFLGLENLENLYLDGCGLNFPSFENTTTETSSTEKSLGIDFPDAQRPFAALSSLKLLQLSNNKITHIYSELFRDNKNIAQLILDGNKIQSYTIPVLRKNLTAGRETISEDRHFTISDNQLSFFTEAMLTDLINLQVHAIDFSKNDFMCDMGACQLRDLIHPPNDTEKASNKSLLPLHINWINLDLYTCVNPETNKRFKIINVTDEVCNSFGKSATPKAPEGPEGEVPAEEASNWTMIIIVSVVSVTTVLAATAVGYKQRAKIRYWLFAAKMNVSSLPRKAKTSITELIQYDFDIFISYHNEDRQFILEKFLPQVESRSDIELDSNTLSRDLESGNNETKTGFKVCLHERDFEAGMPITENIMEAVDRSKKVVIAVSKKYLESQWCTFEMNLAYHRLVESRRKAFVIILLEEIPSNLRTKVLNYLMMSRTYLEWPGDKAPPQELCRFWTRLRRSLMASD